MSSPEYQAQLESLRKWSGYVPVIGDIYEVVQNGKQHFQLLDESIVWRVDEVMGKSGRLLRSAEIRDFVGYNALEDSWYHRWERRRFGQDYPDVTEELASVIDVEIFRDHVEDSMAQGLLGTYNDKTLMILDAANDFIGK